MGENRELVTILGIVVDRRFFKLHAYIDIVVLPHEELRELLIECSDTLTVEYFQGIRRGVKLGDSIEAMCTSPTPGGNGTGCRERGEKEAREIEQPWICCELIVSTPRHWPIQRVVAARRTEDQRLLKPRKTAALPFPLLHPHDHRNKRRQNPHGSKPEERATVLTHWLLQNMGTLMNCGEGVVEVAGGRGDLSCEMALAGLVTTLVDPRPKIMNKVSFSKLSYRRLTATRCCSHSSALVTHIQ